MQNKINITPIPRNVMLKFQAFLIKRMCFNFLHCSINVMIKEYLSILRVAILRAILQLTLIITAVNSY